MMTQYLRIMTYSISKWETFAIFDLLSQINDLVSHHNEKIPEYFDLVTK